MVLRLGFHTVGAGSLIIRGGDQARSRLLTPVPNCVKGFHNKGINGPCGRAAPVRGFKKLQSRFGSHSAPSDSEVPVDPKGPSTQ